MLEFLNIKSVKTRNYHWDVTGAHFNDRHKFFEGYYEQLDEIIDVAERARFLNFKPYFYHLVILDINMPEMK
jgi:DNA-binding ferritin-like protein